MRYWSQNLNEDGAIFWNGRASVYFKACDFGFEWAFGRRVWGASLTMDLRREERALTFHIALPKLFQVFFTIEGLSWIPGYNGKLEDMNRTIGLAMHDGGIWAHLWSDRTGWGPDRTYSFYPVEFLLGRYQSEIENGELSPVEIAMPEGNYTAQVRHIKQTWTRRRFPFLKKTKAFIEFIFDSGLPIPGKGENDWDMGDDAIMGTSVSANSIEEAIEMVTADALCRRERYGGRNWQPEVQDGD